MRLQQLQEKLGPPLRPQPCAKTSVASLTKTENLSLQATRVVAREVASQIVAVSKPSSRTNPAPHRPAACASPLWLLSISTSQSSSPSCVVPGRVCLDSAPGSSASVDFWKQATVVRLFRVSMAWTVFSQVGCIFTEEAVSFAHFDFPPGHVMSAGRRCCMTCCHQGHPRDVRIGETKESVRTWGCVWHAVMRRVARQCCLRPEAKSVPVW